MHIASNKGFFERLGLSKVSHGACCNYTETEGRHRNTLSHFVITYKVLIFHVIQLLFIGYKSGIIQSLKEYQCFHAINAAAILIQGN